jgi:hypothetical protein
MQEGVVMPILLAALAQVLLVEEALAQALLAEARLPLELASCQEVEGILAMVHHRRSSREDMDVATMIFYNLLDFRASFL